MANSTTAAIFLCCLLVVSFSPANSAATCPIDILLRFNSCSGAYNPPKPQCCAALNGVSSQLAADCLCVILQGDSGNKNVNEIHGFVFSRCGKKEPAAYNCV